MDLEAKKREYMDLKQDFENRIYQLKREMEKLED